MADINYNGGGSWLAAIGPFMLFILAKITANDAALWLSILSAAVVFLANLPRAWATVKELIKKRNL